VWAALNLSGSSLVWVLLIGLLMSAASLVAVGFLLAKLPAGYFCERSTTDCSLGRRQGIHWWASRVAKNVLGGAIVILGAVMALPGVPGPGLLVILVGITWTDFPANRRLERWAVTRPGFCQPLTRSGDAVGSRRCISRKNPALKPAKAPGAVRRKRHVTPLSVR
jgi:hypothetical protein